jgi:hypothetical protein
MLRRARLLALPLGFLLAVALGACGSGDRSAATLTQPPPRTQAAAPAATTTGATTTPSTTAPPATTTGTTPATTQTAPATTPTSTQPSGGAPAGCPGAVCGFIRAVRATDCGVASGVANAWFSAVHGGARPDSTIAADGYTCTGALAGERASVSCSDGGGGVVAFTASP